MATYKWSDPEFVDKIILEVKSQGHFDSFRKECLADVDTQPAYQNLHSRVEDTVQRFLNRQVWTPEIKNKNKLREEMRMNIIRAGFLESGVSRIVDQVVEQKMDVIQSKVEEILYKYVGIEKPVKKEEKPQNGTLEIDTTAALLPTDLEQVSPDSDKKSTEEVEEEIAEDFESPAFEPLEPTKVEKPESQNTNLSEISGLTSQDSAKSQPGTEPTKVDTALSQISSTQTHDNIPDTTETEPSVLNVPGLCSEEAQMATGLNDSTENEVKPMDVEKSVDKPKCQFDLKKDQIEFTGTERKSINLDDSTNSGESEKAIQPQDVQSMEVENLYENDTTDSSEMRMEIDLKDESTRGTLKVEESSQDSRKHHHKRDRSSRSSHKSSKHHRSSSKSKVEEKSHKSSSSSHKKSSNDRDRSSSSRRDKDKEHRKSSRSKNDDHQQEKSSGKKRRSTNDSSDSKDGNKPTENTEKGEKSTKKTESDSKSSKEQKSSSKSTSNSNKAIEDEKSNGFVGFEVEELPENPWFKCLAMFDSKSPPFGASNGVGAKKSENSVKKTKSKTPESNDPQNESDQVTSASPVTKSTAATQRYEANDLYKPKFDFSRRRRGQVQEDDAGKTKESVPASN